MNKTIFFLCVAVVCLSIAALGATLLDRLPTQAVLIIVGVSCGIVASIPVSLGLMIALTRPTNYTGGGTIPVEGNRWTGYRTIQESSDPIIIVLPLDEAPPRQLPDGHTRWIEPRQ